jgi:hypothetical protein
MSGQIISAETGGLEPVSAYGSEPPTEGQIKAAREHGIAIPSDATKDELSDLISLSTWHDKQASPELQSIAKGYRVHVTRYTGKKMLFQRIFDHLSQPGREQDLASWFTYRVYRELVGGATGSPVKGPSDPLIQMIARNLAADPAFIASIRRYRGVDLIWFGRWTAPDGTTHEGGSNRTTAYRKAAELLRPFASGERRGKNAERAAAPPGRVDTGPAKGIGAWLARTEQAMRVQNSKPVKVTRWHIAAWAVLVVLLGLFILGPLIGHRW